MVQDSEDRHADGLARGQESEMIEVVATHCVFVE